MSVTGKGHSSIIQCMLLNIIVCRVSLESLGGTIKY